MLTHPILTPELILELEQIHKITAQTYAIQCKPSQGGSVLIKDHKIYKLNLTYYQVNDPGWPAYTLGTSKHHPGKYWLEV